MVPDIVNEWILEIMMKFGTKRLPTEVGEVAPDGSNVRLLLNVTDGVMAHYELPPGETSTAETHGTVEEIWYFLSGRGEMWRKSDDQEEIVEVEAGVCISIPRDTIFQFRSFGHESLTAIGVTMPIWPGPAEGVSVEGIWEPTLP